MIHLLYIIEKNQGINQGLLFLYIIYQIIISLKKIIEERLAYKGYLQYTKDSTYSKLIVLSPHGDIKIEPNYVLRGSCLPAEKSALCAFRLQQTGGKQMT